MWTSVSLWFKVHVPQKGEKQKQELKPAEERCAAFFTVGVSTAQKTKGQCTIRKAHFGHSHCTASANVKVGGIVANSTFLSSLNSDRGASAKSLRNNLKKDHVDVSKQKVYRARAKAGRRRLTLLKPVLNAPKLQRFETIIWMQWYQMTLSKSTCAATPRSSTRTPRNTRPPTASSTPTRRSSSPTTRQGGAG